MEVLALAREGKIRSRIRRFPLSQAPDAYAQLREGKIYGWAVITPKSPDLDDAGLIRPPSVC